MLNRDCHESLDWGNKAVELAQQFGETITLASAYNTVGAALLFIDYERGRETVLTSLRIAGGLRDGGVGVAEAYSMLGSGAGELFDFTTAQRYLTEGLAFAIQHDLDRMAGYMEAWIALIDTYRGNWDAAGDRATSLLPRLQPGSTNRITALIALIRLRIRRGDPGVTELLEEASALGHRSGTLQRLAPVCILSAEHAWMTNDVERVIKETDPAFRLAIQKRHPWFVGELAYWRWKAGEPVDPATVTIVARPYALQFTGNWHEAGDAWMALDCPHEAARAYMDGDHEAQLHALDIFMRLTAKPMIERLRGAMLGRGASNIPRGPRPSTRANPAGLTGREMKVLALVAEGRSNRDIARHLSRSLRTVEHHIAAILGKLTANTRTEAVSAANRLGLLNPK